MAAKRTNPAVARYFYMVTFEIAPDDEPEFNEIYDTEHIPNLLRVDGVVGIIRFKDAAPNAAGWLVYSALYLLARPDLPATPEWIAASAIGCEINRWMQHTRHCVSSRSVADEAKTTNSLHGTPESADVGTLAER